MSELRFIPGAVEKLGDTQGIVDELGRIAEQIAAVVQAPSDQEVLTRKGRSKKGAFAQVIMRGSGAVAIEFGSKNNPPLAPIRSALARFR